MRDINRRRGRGVCRRLHLHWRQRILPVLDDSAGSEVLCSVCLGAPDGLRTRCRGRLVPASRPREGNFGGGHSKGSRCRRTAGGHQDKRAALQRPRFGRRSGRGAERHSERVQRSARGAAGRAEKPRAGCSGRGRISSCGNARCAGRKSLGAGPAGGKGRRPAWFQPMAEQLRRRSGSESRCIRLAPERQAPA